MVGIRRGSLHEICLVSCLLLSGNLVFHRSHCSTEEAGFFRPDFFLFFSVSSPFCYSDASKLQAPFFHQHSNPAHPRPQFSKNPSFPWKSHCFSFPRNLYCFCIQGRTTAFPAQGLCIAFAFQGGATAFPVRRKKALQDTCLVLLAAKLGEAGSDASLDRTLLKILAGEGKGAILILSGFFLLLFCFNFSKFFLPLVFSCFFQFALYHPHVTAKRTAHSLSQKFSYSSEVFFGSLFNSRYCWQAIRIFSSIPSAKSVSWSLVKLMRTRFC